MRNVRAPVAAPSAVTGTSLYLHREDAELRFGHQRVERSRSLLAEPEAQMDSVNGCRYCTWPPSDLRLIASAHGITGFVATPAGRKGGRTDSCRGRLDSGSPRAYSRVRTFLGCRPVFGDRPRK